MSDVSWLWPYAVVPILSFSAGFLFGAFWGSRSHD